MSDSNLELMWHDLQWCLRRLPNCVLKILKQYPNTLFVSGGFIRACVAGEDQSDVDLFATTRELACSCAISITDSDHQLHKTDNAITVKGYRLPVQFIHRWTFDSAESLIASFDFTISMAAFWWDGVRWKSITHPRFYPDLAAKRLIYTSPARIEEVGGSMLRVLKFYQRGYRIPLDSLGAVIARLTSAVRQDEVHTEADVARILSGLLREVDPNVDPSHISHLPSEGDQGGDSQAETAR